jgi:hypothetical protein
MAEKVSELSIAPFSGKDKRETALTASYCSVFVFVVFVAVPVFVKVLLLVILQRIGINVYVAKGDYVVNAAAVVVRERLVERVKTP